jgi:hypothetical protein
VLRWIFKSIDGRTAPFHCFDNLLKFVEVNRNRMLYVEIQCFDEVEWVPVETMVDP